jgi:hypothetical protein
VLQHDDRARVEDRALADGREGGLGARRVVGRIEKRDREARGAARELADRTRGATNTADGAPRDSASMPTPPPPANRSRNGPLARYGVSASRHAMRTRSAVGRVAAPAGVVIRWPFSSPANTLIARASPDVRQVEPPAPPREQRPP